MTLNNTLNTGKTEGAKAVTLYHVSTEVDTFKSFFREGAKAIGKGIGGQSDGFYVWTNEKAADNHIRFLHEDPFADKVLKNNEAIIIGISVPQKSISYPLWQQDMEACQGIFKLWTKYGDFINKNGQNLIIPFDIEDKPLGWNFLTFTGFSYEKKYSHLDQKEWYNISFKGIDERGREKIKIMTRSLDTLNENAEGTDDSVKFQILTDWLCQNNLDFKKDYDHLMQKMCSSEKGGALKYTGIESLAITKAEHVKINEDGSLKKTTIFDASKGKDQVCPFLKLGLTRTRKGK